MNVTLYQFRISPFCDKVRRALKLKGIGWTVVEIPVVPPGKFKHVSPTNKFPAVDFGDRIIVDSTDIIAHLDAIAPEPRLIPGRAVERRRRIWNRWEIT
ncbi:glutathione S-transferase family protein [Sandarakinorhabdus sp. DWP1-3-1]|uniref:glutathione S-transferase family protein n=1 Tax=Sandarakinorhabdus sp. DWP1-3-1 TaxID=2804627 RepID=UPI003CFAA4EB